VRIIVAVATVLIGATTAVAQQQERKLIDRILRPNLTLRNPAQNKKFANSSSATFEKPARTRSFPLARKTTQRTFPQQTVFTPRQFAARHFRAGDSAANIPTRSELTKNDTLIATPTATAGARVAPESTDTAPVREYAGTRPFLDKGKSQKSLQAHNKPLTIEQVRELLNKSK
jgi:hypothetical protein